MPGSRYREIAGCTTQNLPRKHEWHSKIEIANFFMTTYLWSNMVVGHKISYSVAAEGARLSQNDYFIKL